MNFPPEFEAQFADMDLPEFPAPLEVGPRQPGQAFSRGGWKQEFGELKQPDIVAWVGDGLGGVRPVYAVPGFLRDPVEADDDDDYYARQDRRNHILNTLEMRLYDSSLFTADGRKARRAIKAAIKRVRKRKP